MTDETAKQLAEAMTRLAAAIEKLTGPDMSLVPGIHVHYHGLPSGFPSTAPVWRQPYTGDPLPYRGGSTS